jgi:hypothetical protein
MGEREDTEALTVVLRRGAYNVRFRDESRNEAMARAVLASDWLAAHVRARMAAAWDEGVAASAPYGGGYVRSLYAVNPYRAALPDPQGDGGQP